MKYTEHDDITGTAKMNCVGEMVKNSVQRGS